MAFRRVLLSGDRASEVKSVLEKYFDASLFKTNYPNIKTKIILSPVKVDTLVIDINGDGADTISKKVRDIGKKYKMKPTIKLEKPTSPIKESKIKKSELEKIIREWILENHINAENIEQKFFELNELKIDELNSYIYKESSYLDSLGFNKAWEFEDRCGNLIVATYLKTTNEFKTGFRIPGVSTLIFDPKKLPQNHKTLGNLQEKIKPCPDDKRINTVYKILLNEIIPTYLLNKKPNQLHFNPVSSSRERLVNIIINKIIQQYPQLIQQDNYIIYK